MLMKVSFYHRALDSAQNGVFNETIVMSLQPVRSDRNFKLWQILYKEWDYFGMKKKQSGKQRESTYINPAVIIKEYHSNWPKEQ